MFLSDIIDLPRVEIFIESMVKSFLVIFDSSFIDSEKSRGQRVLTDVLEIARCVEPRSDSVEGCDKVVHVEESTNVMKSSKEK